MNYISFASTRVFLFLAAVNGFSSVLLALGDLPDTPTHIPNTAEAVLTELISRPFCETVLESKLRELEHRPDDAELNLRAGISFLGLASEENLSFYDQAAKHLGRAQSVYGGDPAFTMLSGLLKGARAQDDESPSMFARIRMAREAFRIMDAAVERHPNCYLLRVLRGDAQLEAHSFFGRKKFIRQDAEKVEAFLSTDSFDRLSDFEKARLHLFLGHVYERRESRDRERSRYHFNRALILGGDSEIGLEAKLSLNVRGRKAG